jgi:hypothetical protein
MGAPARLSGTPIRQVGSSQVVEVTECLSSTADKSSSRQDTFAGSARRALAVKPPFNTGKLAARLLGSVMILPRSVFQPFQPSDQVEI